ncbi:MAG: metallophosphoesterase family protein [Rhodothermales bacterium]
MGLIAIGDIHGCAKTLDALLEQLSPREDDHLVFIGDYIDRGPDTRGVIDRLLELDQTHTCTFLRGNHEVFLLNHFDGNRHDDEVWYLNGGRQTMKSYVGGSGRDELPESHLTFIRNTKLYLDTPDFFFVHAGLQPHLSVAENLRHPSEKTFLWDRSHFSARFLAWEKAVVCGHTPHPEPINHQQLISIDTGCVYYMYPGMGRLCAVRLPQREFVLVNYIG